MDTKSHQYQIAYLPYIELQAPDFLGNVELLPFYSLQAKDRFPDNINHYLRWYFGKWITSNHQQNYVTLISCRNQMFGPWDEGSRSEIEATVSVLTFLSLLHLNEITPITADNFSLYYQMFKPGDYELAVRSGGYVKITQYLSEDVSETVKFIQPDIIPQWPYQIAVWRADKTLHEAFDRGLKSAFTEPWFQRVLRATTLFNTAFINTHFLRYFERIVLMVSAFEILFDGKASGKGRFGDAVADHLGISSVNDEMKTMVRDFGKNLFELRSRYSHGNDVSTLPTHHPIHGEYLLKGAQLFGLVCKYYLASKGLVIIDHLDIAIQVDVSTTFRAPFTGKK